MKKERLEELLNKLPDTRVAMLGDLCLDVYWKADMRESELSRETPHFPLPVVEERFSLGAGGNVAANLNSLGVGEIYAIGIIGCDWRGRVLLDTLAKTRISAEYIAESAGQVTNAYCKPLRIGISDVCYEDPRLDFTRRRPLDGSEEERLISALREVAGRVDLICVADQFRYGVMSEKVRAEVMRLAREGLRIVVDSRDRVGLYRDVYIKPNEVEVARLLGEKPGGTLEEYMDMAKRITVSGKADLIMTIGERGCIVCERGREPLYVKGSPVKPPLDIVGAGDAFLAGVTCALAAGASVAEAAGLANLVSQVTVKKVGITGTATPQEVLRRYEEI